MKVLPFVLPDFTRLIWHSETARVVWQDRISKINSAWGAIERQAVVDRVRSSCLTFVDPKSLPEASAWAAVRGLLLLPLSQTGIAAQYSSTPQSVQAGRPWHYRAVLTRPELAGKWVDAWAGRVNNSAIGELLGYPSCCINFFNRVWAKEQRVDTTWDMAVGTPNTVLGEHLAQVPAGPAEANILLRWLGVRLVPHLPCSFDCPDTVLNAKQFAEIGRQIAPECVDWIYEMLEWPVEWSALHGIGEVRTPILTISTRVDATGPKYVVQREGTAYPDEGSSGLRFPYRLVTGKVTAKPSFQRSLVPVHELNGFGSEETMNASHDALLSVLPESPGFMLDLGCGTGRLLERAEALGWSVAGVESDAARAGAAQIPIRRGDLLDPERWTGQFDVIACMPGRLLENVTREKADQFRDALKTRAGAVLFYAYGDWLTKYGSLSVLVSEAGLGDCEIVKTAAAAGVEASLAIFTSPRSVAP